MKAIKANTVFKLNQTKENMSIVSQEKLIDLENALEMSHFQNACRTSRYYSCAVDCFLEICYRLILPEIQAKVTFNDRSEFFNLLLCLFLYCFNGKIFVGIILKNILNEIFNKK